MALSMEEECKIMEKYLEAKYHNVPEEYLGLSGVV
jgi:hypothetical protein